MENEKVALSYSELREKYREHAGREFDTAVAVSPDGQRIRHADFVVVYKMTGVRDELIYCHHPGVMFHQNKLVLGTYKLIKEPAPKNRKMSKEKILRGYLLIPNGVRAMVLRALAKTQQVALRIGKLSVLIVPVGAVPDILKPALALIAPPEAAAMYLINKAKKPSGVEGQSSSDEQDALTDIWQRRRSCNPGTISYCAPFDHEKKPHNK